MNPKAASVVTIAGDAEVDHAIATLALVVEGTARVLYGDKTFDATAGTVVSLARGIPHAWGNPTDTPLRLVITSTPGGVEEVLRLIATSGDQLDLAALADKHAVRLIGPPLLGV
jgi:uncharacterized RmlC-like cupin family protein